MLHWSKHSENTFITTTKFCLHCFVKCINIFSIQRERKLKKCLTENTSGSWGGGDIKIIIGSCMTSYLLQPPPFGTCACNMALLKMVAWSRNLTDLLVIRKQ